MARGMNKVMIIGFVEREPEVRYTPEGQPVATFCISANRRLGQPGKIRDRASAPGSARLC
jgi:single-stranded DNA-binding protein